MRKLFLIIGIFGVLSVGMFISGCNEDDKKCTCTESYSGTGSENLSTNTYTDYVTEDQHCSDVLNKSTTDANGLTTTINCVGS